MLTADYTRVDPVGWREAVSARQASYFPQSSAASRLTSANAPSDGLIEINVRYFYDTYDLSIRS